MYKNYFKRLFDFTSALMLLMCVFPFMLILAFLVKCKLGSPIFFTQERSTINGKTYKLIKFRTMTSKCDVNGVLLPDDQRKTKFGAWLRNTSLDELPELYNIIKGDMAVIGPRPMPSKYNTYYREYEKNRFLVRGGLLPPEVLYDNPIPTWDEQLKWEADYGINCSFSLDVMIFYKTFKLLFARANNNYGEYHRKSLSEERIN